MRREPTLSDVVVFTVLAVASSIAQVFLGPSLILAVAWPAVAVANAWSFWQYARKTREHIAGLERQLGIDRGVIRTESGHRPS